MKTISFIGSDKNAGKTTVFNYVRTRLREPQGKGAPVCVTSIGINGEDSDAYETRPKPRIRVFRNDWFITASEHLKDLTGKYDIIHVFSMPGFRKPYVMGKSLFDVPMVLEGPNDKHQLLRMKQELSRIIGRGRLLIDGSIDRQFAAHPAISDEVFFALLVSKRKEQMQKARDLVFALSIPACSNAARTFLDLHAGGARSLLFDENNRVWFRGNTIPFLDDDLKQACINRKDKKNILYINGALSASFFTFLSPMRRLSVILDNFTLYQNVSVRENVNRMFRPELALYQPVLVKKIFVKQETDRLPEFPGTIRVHNLYRDDPHEIGI